MCSQDGAPEGNDVENPEDEELDEEAAAALQEFQREAHAISQAIGKMEDTIEEIRTHYDKSLQQSSGEDKASLQNEIARMLQENEKRSDAIRKRLRRIAGENKEFVAQNGEKTGEIRVRVNTHQGMTRRFMEAMQTFELVQEKHRDTVRRAMEAHVRKMNPDASEDEISEAVRNGQANLLADQSQALSQLPPEEQQRLKNGLEDLASRNNDIKKLEESIIQLHQLFMDMQALVDAQGELLNNIEYNVEETKGATAAAHDELVIAREHQKSANKKKCIVAVLVVLILLAVLVPILIIYIPKWFPSTKDTIEALPIVGTSAPTESEPAAASNTTRARANGTRGGRAAHNMQADSAQPVIVRALRRSQSGTV